MVGYDDPLDTMFHSQLCVLFRQDTFNDNGQAGERLQPVYVFPADGWVQRAGRNAILFRFCSVLYENAFGLNDKPNTRKNIKTNKKKYTKGPIPDRTKFKRFLNINQYV